MSSHCTLISLLYVSASEAGLCGHLVSVHPLPMERTDRMLVTRFASTLSHYDGHIAIEIICRTLRQTCLPSCRYESRISAANVIYAPHLEMERRRERRREGILALRPSHLPLVHCTPYFAGMGMRACKHGVILQAWGQQKK